MKSIDIVTGLFGHGNIPSLASYKELLTDNTRSEATAHLESNASARPVVEQHKAFFKWLTPLVFKDPLTALDILTNLLNRAVSPYGLKARVKRINVDYDSDHKVVISWVTITVIKDKSLSDTIIFAS